MIHLNTLLVREKAARGKLLQLSTLLHATSGYGTTTAWKRSSVRAGEELDRKESVNHETLVFQGLNHRPVVPIQYAVLKNTILLINKYLNGISTSSKHSEAHEQGAKCGMEGTV